MTERISPNDTIVGVEFLTDEEKRSVYSYFKDKNRHESDLSKKLVAQNTDNLLKLYQKYKTLADDWVRKKSSDIYYSNSDFEFSEWWNYIPAIIKDAKLKGQVKSVDLWGFFTNTHKLQCLYEYIYLKLYNEKKDYSEKFKTYRNVAKNEKNYTQEIADVFNSKGYTVRKEVGVKVYLLNNRSIIRFIDIIAASTFSVNIIECKSYWGDADHSQLSEYQKIFEFVRVNKEKSGRFYRYFFITQSDISYIPKGNYPFDIYSLGSLNKTFFYEQD